MLIGSRVFSMESKLISVPKIVDNQLDIISTIGPILLDGVFSLNIKDEDTVILRMPNESNQTIHFTPWFIDHAAKPHVFGRLIDLDGKKIEGVLTVEIEKPDEPTQQILQSSTEKVNFSHPTKPGQRMMVESSTQACCAPGDTLIVKLKSRVPLDTMQSKIVFEDLVFAEVM